MENEAALPEATTAEVSTEAKAAPETFDAQTGEPVPPAEAKPEKTEAERERSRMQRGIDRRTRQLEEARSDARQLREQLTRHEKGVNYQSTADDSEPLSLTRAQVDELVKAEAAKLAPTLRDEALETERRQGVIQSLAKTWGQEKFDELSSDLDDAFGGLTDRSGRPKPAIEAVFESDHPNEVIEYLADPDNLDEAERISKLSAVQAGKAIERLEAKIKVQREADKASGKPKASKAPAPLESVRRSSAPASSGLSDELTSAEWLARRNKQLRERNN